MSALFDLVSTPTLLGDDGCKEFFSCCLEVERARFEKILHERISSLKDYLKKEKRTSTRSYISNKSVSSIPLIKIIQRVDILLKNKILENRTLYADQMRSIDQLMANVGSDFTLLKDPHKYFQEHVRLFSIPQMTVEADHFCLTIMHYLIESSFIDFLTEETLFWHHVIDIEFSNLWICVDRDVHYVFTTLDMAIEYDENSLPASILRHWKSALELLVSKDAETLLRSLGHAHKSLSSLMNGRAKHISIHMTRYREEGLSDGIYMIYEQAYDYFVEMFSISELCRGRSPFFNKEIATEEMVRFLRDKNCNLPMK